MLCFNRISLPELFIRMFCLQALFCCSLESISSSHRSLYSFLLYTFFAIFTLLAIHVYFQISFLGGKVEGVEAIFCFFYFRLSFMSALAIANMPAATTNDEIFPTRLFTLFSLFFFFFLWILLFLIFTPSFISVVLSNLMSVLV